MMHVVSMDANSQYTYKTISTYASFPPGGRSIRSAINATSEARLLAVGGIPWGFPWMQPPLQAAPEITSCFTPHQVYHPPRTQKLKQKTNESQVGTKPYFFSGEVVEERRRNNFTEDSGWKNSGFDNPINPTLPPKMRKNEGQTESQVYPPIHGPKEILGVPYLSWVILVV